MGEFREVEYESYTRGWRWADLRWPIIKMAAAFCLTVEFEEELYFFGLRKKLVYKVKGLLENIAGFVVEWGD